MDPRRRGRQGAARAHASRAAGEAGTECDAGSRVGPEPEEEPDGPASERHEGLQSKETQADSGAHEQK